VAATVPLPSSTIWRSLARERTSVLVQDLSLLRKVVQGGFCIGCGLCVVDQPGLLRMEMSSEGLWQAAPARPSAPVDEPLDRRLMSVCPFGDAGLDEDGLSAVLFPGLSHDEALGRSLLTAVGWVQDDAARLESSSGGLTTWLLERLLDTGAVDTVLHVAEAPASADGPRYSMVESSSLEELRLRRKTRYYPVHYAQVADALRGARGRLAVVGVPCFIKGIRRLVQAQPDLAEHVTFTVALICGHMKTTQWHDYLIANLKGAPEATQTFDFRHKLPEERANKYGVRWESVSGDVRTAPVAQVPLSSWNYGLFKPKACDFCDDVMGETADVTFGDAWLPGYVEDYRGANVVVVRDPHLATLLKAGSAEGHITLEPISNLQAAASQTSSFRHRRRGLAARLTAARVLGAWTPPKRVRPAAWPLDRDSRVAATRFAIARASRAHFPTSGGDSADAADLVERLQPHVRLHNRLQVKVRERLRSRFRRLQGRARGR
jgi:coenzyme F420 hydrogenase subunit beta